MINMIRIARPLRVRDWRSIARRRRFVAFEPIALAVATIALRVGIRVGVFVHGSSHRGVALSTGDAMLTGVLHALTRRVGGLGTLDRLHCLLTR